jgi:hypothetical protein
VRCVGLVRTSFADFVLPRAASGSVIKPGSALTCLARDVMGGAVQCALRTALHDSCGYYGTGCIVVHAGPPAARLGVGAVLVSRHFVSSAALVTRVYFDESRSVLDSFNGQHQLLASRPPMANPKRGEMGSLAAEHNQGKTVRGLFHGVHTNDVETRVVCWSCHCFHVLLAQALLRRCGPIWSLWDLYC